MKAKTTEKAKSLRSMIGFFVIPKVMSVVVLSLLITAGIFHFQTHTYVDRFIGARTNSLQDFLRQYEGTLRNYARIHGQWTELLDKIDEGDFLWIQENASQNIVEETGYDVDLVYIKDEWTGFESIAGVPKKGIEYLRSQTVRNEWMRDFQEGIFEVDGELYLINGTYLSDNDRMINRGVYLVGRRMDDSFWEKMNKSMDVELLRGMRIEREERSVRYPNFFDNTVEFSVILNHTSNEQPLFLRLKYDLDYLYTFFYIGEFGLIFLILMGILFIVHLIFRALKQSVAKLDPMRDTLHQMKDGAFGSQIDYIEIEEIDEFIDSFNLMSTGLASYQKQVDQDQVEMVRLMVKAMDINDEYTKGHAERVAIHARQLAELLNHEDPLRVQIAGLLHDVGKLSVPTQILNKPGKLSDEEYRVVQEHAQRGYELLNQSAVFESIVEAVRFHHERVDGKGYPCGLMGEEIPIEAKIISVCDVYDALVTDRPYRKAMDHDQAINIIQKECGQAFDETVVAGFLLMIEEEWIGSEEREQMEA